MKHRARNASDAALRSGKIGPRKAEPFADLANRTRVEFLMRASHRQFSGAPFVVNGHGSVTVSAPFLLGIEATALFS